jgi:hypothetical protein
MRIREENRNLVLLTTVTLFAGAVAGLLSLIAPTPATTEGQSAYLADQTPVRVVGVPFAPNTNPRERQ